MPAKFKTACVIALMLLAPAWADTIAELRPAIFEAAASNQVDPVLMEAIMRHESANGKSKAARKHNNFAGIMAGRRIKHFSSPQECVSYLGQLLGKYRAKGRTTVPAIARVYCTAPYRGEWMRCINSFSASITAGKWGALPTQAAQVTQPSSARPRG